MEGKYLFRGKREEAEEDRLPSISGLIVALKGIVDCNHEISMSAVTIQNQAIGELNRAVRENIQRQDKINALFADRINRLISILEEQGILVTLPDISEEINKFEKGDFS